MSSSRPNAFFGGGAVTGAGGAGACVPRGGVAGFGGITGGGVAGRGGGVGRAVEIGGGVGIALPGSLNLNSDGGGDDDGPAPPGRDGGSAPASRSIVPRPPSGAGPSSESRFVRADFASRPSLS